MHQLSCEHGGLLFSLSNTMKCTINQHSTNIVRNSASMVFFDGAFRLCCSSSPTAHCCSLFTAHVRADGLDVEY